MGANRRREFEKFETRAFPAKNLYVRYATHRRKKPLQLTKKYYLFAKRYMLMTNSTTQRYKMVTPRPPPISYKSTVTWPT